MKSNINNRQTDKPDNSRKGLCRWMGPCIDDDALDRKYPNAPKEWRWQWVFPQENRWKNTKTSEEGWHQTHETILQRGVKEAIRNAGVVKTSGWRRIVSFVGGRSTRSVSYSKERLMIPMPLHRGSNKI